MNEFINSIELEWHQPLCDLLNQLPQLVVNEDGTIDFEASNPDVLLMIGDSATVCLGDIHLGIAGIARLIALSAKHETIPNEKNGDLVAAAWLVRELSLAADMISELAADCRAHTADYDP